MSAKDEGSFSPSDIFSTGCAMVAVTSAFAVARIATHFIAPRKITIEDGLVFLAYASNLTMCSLYIALSQKMTKINDMKAGKIIPYPEVRQDGTFIARCYFANLMIFFLILWTVKFAFLLLYRRLLSGLSKTFAKVWWSIFAICVATLIVSLALYLSVCDDISTLVNGGCNDMTPTEQLLSLLFSYGSDTVTNLMIMALPIRLTWNLQMPRGKKIGVLLIFGAAIICVAVASVRAGQIVNKMRTYNLELDGTWLAVWGMAEASTAVIIVFAPAFAALIRVSRDKKFEARGYDSRGYHKHPSDRSGGNSQTGHFALATFSSRGNPGGRKKLDITDSYYDGASSQENLNKCDDIKITTTVEQTFGPKGPMTPR